ncbi:MAG TPA: acyl-CoA thioesterase [Candidatus Limnocylindria bacterium]|jgi:enediyne biosynthesis thioesterase|nr:acyl-CoA thioesterase [Candidatus Limnocylindria bacterium]
MARTYEYRHVVGFQETNLVGNVYYTNHVAWQGRVREMFLREHAPGIVAELMSGLALATLRCSCEYFMELHAFDDVAIRMQLAEMVQNRITMTYEYWRQKGTGEELVARGEQQIACLRREGESVVATPIPAELRAALQPFLR